jgi:Hemerythrin HHE cation binding domain
LPHGFSAASFLLPRSAGTMESRLSSSREAFVETEIQRRRNQSRRSRSKPESADKRAEAREPKGVLERIVEVFRSEDDGEQKISATKLLKKDHDRVRDLFKQYEDAGERAYQTKKQLVETMSDELDIHAQIEEEIFYQAFRNVAEKEPKKLVRESFEEHLIVKRLIAELARMGPQDGQFDAKVTVLKESVEHHAGEEERELFPDAQKLFSDERLEELGAEMQAMKQKLKAGKKS